VLVVARVDLREVNAGFFYKTATEREAMVAAERKFIDDRVAKIVALKKAVCPGYFSLSLSY
jgi:T-complex protein 1 subunit zeta